MESHEKSAATSIRAALDMGQIASTTWADGDGDKWPGCPSPELDKTQQCINQMVICVPQTRYNAQEEYTPTYYYK